MIDRFGGSPLRLLAHLDPIIHATNSYTRRSRPILGWIDEAMAVLPLLGGRVAAMALRRSRLPLSQPPSSGFSGNVFMVRCL